MSTNIVINSRGRIPSDVLKGRVRKFKSVNTIFVNSCLQQWLFRLHKSYWSRSHLDDTPNPTWGEKDGGRPVLGREDDYGNVWHQLKPETYKIKQEEQAEGTINSYLRNRRSKAADSVRRRLDKLDLGSGDGINIRSGRLLASTFPGPIVNNRLYTTRDQNVERVGSTGIHWDNNAIPYVNSEEEGDAMNQFDRPIIPNEETNRRWWQESIDASLDLAEQEYRRLLDKEETRKKNKAKTKKKGFQ